MSHNWLAPSSRVQIICEPQSVPPEVSRAAARLRNEYVVCVRGVLRARKDPNPKIPTGQVGNEGVVRGIWHVFWQVLEMRAGRAGRKDLNPTMHAGQVGKGLCGVFGAVLISPACGACSGRGMAQTLQHTPGRWVRSCHTT